MCCSLLGGPGHVFVFRIRIGRFHGIGRETWKLNREYSLPGSESAHIFLRPFILCPNGFHFIQMPPPAISGTSPARYSSACRSSLERVVHTMQNFRIAGAEYRRPHLPVIRHTSLRLPYDRCVDRFYPGWLRIRISCKTEYSCDSPGTR